MVHVSVLRVQAVIKNTRRRRAHAAADHIPRHHGLGPAVRRADPGGEGVQAMSKQSAKRAAAVAMYRRDPGMTAAAISRALTLSPGVVRQYLRDAGCSPALRWSQRGISKGEVLRLHGEGHGSSAIAAIMGSPESSVRSVLRRAGVRPKVVHPPPLTEEQAREARRLRREGWSVRRIAQRLGRGHTSIRTALRRWRVPRVPRQWLTPADKARVLDLANSGHTIVAIMAWTGRSEQAIRRVLRRAGVQRGRPRLDRSRIVALLTAGCRIGAIVAETGCAPGSVYRISLQEGVGTAGVALRAEELLLAGRSIPDIAFLLDEEEAKVRRLLKARIHHRRRRDEGGRRSARVS